MIGTALGAAVFGALFGPVIGAAAALLGRGPVFSALGALAVALAVWTTRLETSHPAERASTSALTRALRTREFLGGLSVMSLASLLFGVLSVLGPLHLSHAGWGAAAIGAVWLTGAAGETVQAPLIGRVLDRRGHLLPVRASLLASALVSLGLATGARPLFYVPLVVLAAIAYGGLFTPAFGLIADGAEHAALAQGLAFGFMNAAWALGAMVGPAAGGAIAGATGDWIPFVLVAAVCLVTLAATRSRPEHAAVLVAGAATSTHRRRQ
jgi:MFS family permease